MKFFIVVAVAVACVAADVSHLESQAPVLKSDYEVNPDGAFRYAYETGNGIAASADGVVKNPAGENPALEIQGGYKYISPEGFPVEVSYVANENGFQPAGNVIPTPHPIPEAIARSLAYIAAHPPLQEKTYAKRESIYPRSISDSRSHLPPSSIGVLIG